MRIDPKYFNQFMLVVAVFCIAAIFITSLRYIGKQEDRFLNRLENQKLSDLVFQNMDGDTITITRDQTTVLLFWSTWSDRSIEVLHDLYQWHDQHPDIEVIASYIKDSDDFAASHNREGKERFVMLNGTSAYQDLRVPGIPTAIVFDSKGDIYAVEIGYRDRPVWHAIGSGGNRQNRRPQ